jgi:hypothetical protein
MSNPDRIARLGQQFPDLTLGQLEGMAAAFTDLDLLRKQAILASRIARMLWDVEALLDNCTRNGRDIEDDDRMLRYRTRKAIQAARPFLPSESR